VVHPPIRPAPRQRAKMCGLTTVRTFITVLSLQANVDRLPDQGSNLGSCELRVRR
jgi:hypothetical protein